jgi:uncharacterized protein (TIGR03790 family)
MMRGGAALLLGIAFLTMIPRNAIAQTAKNVAVVINDASADSRRIGEYYAQRRGVPQTNVIHLQAPAAEEMTWRAFVNTIQTPIASALARGNLQDRVLYIVLTKGIPIRVSAVTPRGVAIMSVDSELTLLYRNMTGRPGGANAPQPNPYFVGAGTVADARPFTHAARDIYLVTRIDAFTVAEALALVDAGRAPVTRGRIVLDERDALQDHLGEEWLDAAAERLRAMGDGDRVMLDTNVKPLRNVQDVLGYFSWGSNDPGLRVRRVGLGFVPGAIAATYLSADARTFQEPPSSWVPASGSSDKNTWWAGSPQSLIGDLLREGATGAAGNVAQPSLAATVRPQILFPAYLAGFSLAESFYLSVPFLGAQTVIIGDPLCRPFTGKTVPQAELDPPIDAAMELPRFFARRLAETVRVQFGLNTQADIALAVRAQVRLARGDRAAAQRLLTDLTKAVPDSFAAELELAGLLKENGESDLAIAHYRRVLKLRPQHPLALNNLAYLLATETHSLSEAKALADESLKLLPRDPSVLDTAGWIAYLSGDHAQASKLLAQAVNGLPDDAEVRLHAAFAYAASGARAAALSELDVVSRLDPALAKREDVLTLRKTLGEPRLQN